MDSDPSLGTMAIEDWSPDRGPNPSPRNLLDSTMWSSGLESEARESYVKFDDMVTSFHIGNSVSNSLWYEYHTPVRYTPDFILPNVKGHI